MRKVFILTLSILSFFTAVSGEVSAISAVANCRIHCGEDQRRCHDRFQPDCNEIYQLCIAQCEDRNSAPGPY